MLTPTFSLDSNPIIDNFVSAFNANKEKMVEKFAAQILHKVALYTESLNDQMVFSKSTNGTERDLVQFCIDIPMDDLDVPEYLYFEVQTFFNQPFSALDGKYRVFVTPYFAMKKITITMGEV